MEKGGFCYKYVAGLRRLMFATKSHDAIGGGWCWGPETSQGQAYFQTLQANSVEAKLSPWESKGDF